MILFLATMVPKRNGVSYFDCGVNINGYKYNLTQLSEQIGTQKHENIVYKLCNPLEENDFNEKANFEEGVMLIKNDEIYGFSGTQHFQTFDDENESSGVYLTYKQQSGKIQKSAVFELICDSAALEPQSINYQIEENNYSSTVFISMRSKFACPEISKVEQKHFEPKCRIYKEFDESLTKIDFDLRNFNADSVYPIHLDKNENIFYQPCEERTCPSGYTCPENETGNIWYCKGTKCNSYGSLTDEITHEISEKSTIIKQKKAEIKYSCDTELLNDSPVFVNASLENDILKINAVSVDACPVERSDSMINNAYLFERHEHKIKLDLNNKNYLSPEEIQIKGDDAEKLLLNPFNNISCPEGYSCDSSYASHAWICKEEEESKYCINLAYADSTPTTISGQLLFNENVQLQYDTPSTSFVFDFQCDEKLKSNEAKYKENSFSFDGKDTYKASFYVKDVCNINWSLPVYENGIVPEEVERLSRIVYKTNGTHAIKFDISSVDIMESTPMLLSEYDANIIGSLFYLTPFTMQPCPFPDACVERDSDGYICSKREANSTMNCTSISSYKVPFEASLLDNDINKGINVKFQGQDNVKFNLRLVCNNHASGYVIYHTQPDTFTYDIYTLDVCPTNVLIPTIPPTPAPTPTPSSQEIPHPRINVNGKEIGISDIEVTNQIVQLQFEDGHREDVHMYIKMNKLKKCVKGANCLGNSSTVFKCWDSDTEQYYCLPVGDARWGIDVNKASFTIKNGFGGYKTTINLKCGEKDEDNEYVLEEKGTEKDKHIQLYLNHPDLCNISPVTENLTAEWICVYILLAIAILFILYLAVGSLIVKIKTGECEIPNALAWSAVFSCSCCKKKANLESTGGQLLL